MSTLLEQASLVMIPSGYKEDVVYSQIPTDGSGDLSFTRASNGTRINSTGLVEVCPWNLLSDSNTFTAGWAIGIGGGSLGSFVADPFGGTTAQVLNLNNNGILYNSSVSPYPTTISTTSIWMRTQSGSVSIQLGNPIGSPYYTKTITTTWTRFDIQVDPSAFNGGIALYNSVHGSAITIEIFGAQVNIGSTAKPYFPTTDRLNVPRLTYQNGGGGCPSLLLEKQSTNFLTFSEDFSNAAWIVGAAGGGSNPVITANNATSPDGTQNADKIVFVAPASGDISQIQQITTLTGTATGSIYIKAVSSDDVGKIIAIRFNSGTYTLITLTADWQRFSTTQTSLLSFDIALRPALGTSTGTVSAYIWGAQLEASSYPTSYIPTTSSSATRVADVCSKTGISSLLGGVEGTWFLELDYKPISSSTNPTMFVNSLSSTIGIASSGVNTLRVRINAVNDIIATVNPTNRHKIAISFNASGVVCYVNGSSIALPNGASQVVSNLETVNLETGTRLNDINVYQMLYFQTRLTNAELASITSL